MQTKIITTDPKRIRLLELNARFMRHETFARLVANIKKDGDLTQTPFGAIVGYYSESRPRFPRTRTQESRSTKFSPATTGFRPQSQQVLLR